MLLKAPWITGLLVVAGVLSLQVQAQTVEERLDRIEKKMKRDKSSLSEKIDGLAEQFTINGFLTAGLATHDGDGVYDDTEISDELCFHCDSLVGLQMNFAIDEKSGITTQFLGEGGTDTFDVGMEWAYFYYKPQPNLTLRTGRMRTPFYANSEFLDVGFAYPWARLPKEIYNLTLSTFEGIDLNYRTSAGPLDMEFQTYLGSAVQLDPTYDYSLDNAIGAIVKTTYGPASVRLGYHVTNLDFDLTGDADSLATSLAAIGVEDLEADGAKGSFTNVALTWDDGSLYAQIEYANLKAEDFLFRSVESITAITGYKIDQWMPYVYYTHAESNNKDEYEQNIATVSQTSAALTPAIAVLNAYDPTDPVSVATVQTVLSSLAATDPTLAELASDIGTSGGGNEFAVAQVASGLQDTVNGLGAASAGLFAANIIEQTSYGLGVRYDLTPKTAVTLEAQRFTDFGDDLSSKGYFKGYSDRDDVTMYSVVFNAVF